MRIDRVIAGFIAVVIAQQFVDQLFIGQRWQHLGLGSVLLNQAKVMYPQALHLDTLQINSRACSLLSETWV